jgi:PKD repeat protein
MGVTVSPTVVAEAPGRSRHSMWGAGRIGLAVALAVLICVAVLQLSLPTATSPSPQELLSASVGPLTGKPAAHSAASTEIFGSPTGVIGQAAAQGMDCPPAGPVGVNCPTSAIATGGANQPTLGFQPSGLSLLSPHADALGNVVWDLSSNEGVYFGGFGGTGPTNETWLFVNGSWTNVTNSAHAPPPRWGSSMAYDAELGVQAVVLFGGNGTGGLLNDTWLFLNNNTWVPVHSTGVAPPELFDASMTSWGQNGTLLFGGCSDPSCSAESSATWAFQVNSSCSGGLDGACWIDLDEHGHIRGVSPPGLAGFALGTDPAFGPEDGSVLLYGGFNRTCTSSCVPTFSNATWLFDGHTWTNITSSFAGQPYPSAPRAFSSLFWDPVSGLLYLYGGYSDSPGEHDSEFWSTTVDSWVNCSSLTALAPRYAVDVASGADTTAGLDFPALLFGGYNVSRSLVNGLWPSGSPGNDTWAFEPSLEVSVAVTPNPVETNASVSFFSNITGGIRPNAAWNFGDGYRLASGNGSHVYASVGEFVARLVATDVGGQEAAVNVTVLARPFGIGLHTPSSLDVGQVGEFSISPVNGTGPFNSTWTFSDGGVASGMAVLHSFETEGAASATVTATDATGTVVAQTGQFFVNPALVGHVSANPGSVDEGSSTVLTASAAGGTPPYSYAWILPGGRTATGVAVAYTPTSTGSETFELEITDGAGGSWSTSVPMTVNSALQFLASASPTSFYSGRTVSFSAVVTGGTAPYSYSWDFGDGGTSSAASPSHTYRSSGTFLVNVWVNDSGGGTAHQIVDAKVVRTAGGVLWLLGALPIQIRLGILAAAVAVVALLAVLMIRYYRRRQGGIQSSRVPPGAPQ